MSNSDRPIGLSEVGREPSLSEVVAIIPKDCYENPAWKGLWFVFRDGLMYLTLVAALLATDRLLLLIPLWALSGLVVSALFIIGHDAAHKSLFKSRSLCDLIGKMAMLPSLHNYSAWVLGHNRVHHGFTVHEERDFVWHPSTKEEYAAFSRWKKLSHRLQWSCFGAGIYYMIEVWFKKMMAFKAPAKVATDIRKDQVFLIAGALLGAGFFCGFAMLTKDDSLGGTLGYALWLIFKVMVVPWVCFNYIIGSAVYLHHIHPEIKWHEHVNWTKFKAQMEGTMVYRVPRILNIFLHDIMIHVPHHVDGRIPFYNLKKAAEHLHRAYPGIVRDVKLKFRDYLNATRRCKLYDFKREFWTDYQGRLATDPEA